MKFEEYSIDQLDIYSTHMEDDTLPAIKRLEAAGYYISLCNQKELYNEESTDKILRMKAVLDDIDPDDYDLAECYACVCIKFAEWCYFQSDNDAVLQYAQKARHIAENFLQSDHAVWVDIYNCFGALYSEGEDSQAAIEAFSEAIELGESLQGKENVDLLPSYSNISWEYGKQGNSAQELYYQKKCAALCERVYGPEAFETAEQYYSLAEIFHAQQQSEEAVEYFFRSLDGCRKQYGEYGIDMVKPYGAIAREYQAMCKYDLAISFRESILECYAAAGWENDIRSAREYNRIGLLYSDSGEFHRARASFEKALVIGENCGNEGKELVVVLHGNLAYLYDNMWEYEKAMQEYELVLENIELHDTPYVIYDNLTRLARKTDQFEKGLEYSDLAVKFVEEKYPYAHPEKAIVYINRGLLFSDNNDHEKAMQCYEKALDLLENSKESNHSMGVLLHNIACVYRDMKEYSRAFEYYKKALAVQAEKTGFVHPEMASLYHSIACFFLDQKKYEEALPFFCESTLLFVYFLGEGQERAKEEKENLMLCWKQSGRTPANFENWWRDQMRDAGIAGGERRELNLYPLTLGE